MYDIYNYKDATLHAFIFSGFSHKMSMPDTFSVRDDIRHDATSTFYDAVDSRNTSNLEDLVYYQQDTLLHKALETYVTPALTVLSLIANALIFAVFSMRVYKDNLTAMLYQVLAATDGISVMIRIGYHAMTPDSISCKVIGVLFCWSRFVSGWLIVIITVARVIIVWFPHKSKQMNTKRRYGCIIGCMSVVSFIFCSPLCATAGCNYDAEMEGQQRLCMFFRRDHVGKMEWYRLVFSVSIALSVSIRLLFVFIANGFIVYGIKKSRRDVNSSTTGSNDVDNRKNKNATIILLISSTSVLFSTTDIIYAILSSYYNDPNSNAYSSLLMFRDFLPVFDCINRSINIIFFSVFGAEFRQRLRDILSCPFQITDISNLWTSFSRTWVWFLQRHGHGCG